MGVERVNEEEDGFHLAGGDASSDLRITAVGTGEEKVNPIYDLLIGSRAG